MPTSLWTKRTTGGVDCTHWVCAGGREAGLIEAFTLCICLFIIIVDFAKEISYFNMKIRIIDNIVYIIALFFVKIRGLLKRSLKEKSASREA